MDYRVELSPTAIADLDNLYQWIAEQSVERAASWLEGCYQAIVSLERFPERCSLAIESEAIGMEIRQLVYQRTTRILFTIVGSTGEQGGVVQVHRVRRSAQRRLQQRNELEEDEGKEDI